MSKIVFIKENSPEVRKKLRRAGFEVCACAEFKDSIWLDYHPYHDSLHKNIHGVGYTEDDGDNRTPLERIEDYLQICGYFSNEREFFNSVDDFLEMYPKPTTIKKNRLSDCITKKSKERCLRI